MSEQIEKKNIQIKIAISELKFVDFHTTNRVQELKKPLDLEGYEFNFNFQSKLLKAEKLLNVHLTITANEKRSEMTRNELAKLQMLISFKIENFDEIFTFKENNIVNIPNEVIALTAGIAVASARGIFATKVQDTVISNAIIPIVDPRMFIPPPPSSAGETSQGNIVKE